MLNFGYVRFTNAMWPRDEFAVNSVRLVRCKPLACAKLSVRGNTNQDPLSTLKIQARAFGPEKTVDWRVLEDLS